MSFFFVFDDPPFFAFSSFLFFYRSARKGLAPQGLVERVATRITATDAVALETQLLLRQAPSMPLAIQPHTLSSCPSCRVSLPFHPPITSALILTHTQDTDMDLLSPLPGQTDTSPASSPYSFPPLFSRCCCCCCFVVVMMRAGPLLIHPIFPTMTLR